MINKINPLYILAFFTTIMLISFLNINSAKKELNDKIEEYNDFKKSAYEYGRLKKVWQNRNSIDKKINKIVSKYKDIEYKNYSSKYVLTLKSNDTNTMQSFLSTILNDGFRVLRFDIKKEIIVLELAK